MRQGPSPEDYRPGRRDAVNTMSEGYLATHGVHFQDTRPVRDRGRGWPDLGPDIVSHLKPVVMTCKY